MSDRVTVCDYLDGPETLQRRELEFGVVREPPAPFFDHQAVVTGLAAPIARRHTSWITIFKMP